MRAGAEALAQLEALSDSARAAQMAAYHKAPRRYLGLSVPQIDTLCREWRAVLDVPGRVTLAAQLWDSDVHEARVAAARLLTQARIRPDDAVWREVLRWVPGFDAWAIADHAAAAGSRRLVADPARIDIVAGWTTDANMWVRRAAFVFTLPWAKMPFPAPADLEIRERVLGWAAEAVADREWFIQKAIGWWLRDLSRRDPERVRRFLDGPGAGLKPFARREAAKYL